MQSAQGPPPFPPPLPPKRYTDFYRNTSYLQNEPFNATIPQYGYNNSAHQNVLRPLNNPFTKSGEMNIQDSNTSPYFNKFKRDQYYYNDNNFAT
mmetsp:Transcript_11543/g.19514  ORF Transcript_11543/g.19514 Transcript_11543/m.19514 type:complete len:94 (-) Transcript_11543:190-471(-)